jgi:hypothetical protein
MPLRLRPRARLVPTSTAVIAGLDPAIHLLRDDFLRRMMDARVKPRMTAVSRLALRLHLEIDIDYVTNLPYKSRYSLSASLPDTQVIAR